MKKRRIVSEHVGEPQADTWSNCLVIGEQVYIAGLGAFGGDLDGDIAADDAYGQAAVIFTKMKHLMEEAGGCIDDVVKVLIYMTKIADREEVWRARREFFTGDYPVSTLIEISKLARPEMCVEIEAIAILGAGGTPP
jgi:enamine deaminase RidA (YjgF/YER057c/UK114 family)